MAWNKQGSWWHHVFHVFGCFAAEFSRSNWFLAIAGITRCPYNTIPTRWVAEQMPRKNSTKLKVPESSLVAMVIGPGHWHCLWGGMACLFTYRYLACLVWLWFAQVLLFCCGWFCTRWTNPWNTALLLTPWWEKSLLTWLAFSGCGNISKFPLVCYPRRLAHEGCYLCFGGVLLFSESCKSIGKRRFPLSWMLFWLSWAPFWW